MYLAFSSLVTHSRDPIKVYCDFTHDNGGWTLFYANNNYKSAFPFFSYQELYEENKIRPIDLYHLEDTNITVFVPPHLLEASSWMVRDLRNWKEEEFISLHFPTTQLLLDLLNPQNITQVSTIETKEPIRYYSKYIHLYTSKGLFNSSVSDQPLSTLYTDHGLGVKPLSDRSAFETTFDCEPGLEEFPIHFLGNITHNEPLFRTNGCGGYISGTDNLVCGHFLKEELSSFLAPVLSTMLHAGNIVCKNRITITIQFNEYITEINQQRVLIQPSGKVDSITSISPFFYVMEVTLPEDTIYSISLLEGFGTVGHSVHTLPSNTLRFRKDSSLFCIDFSLSNEPEPLGVAYINRSPIPLLITPSQPLKELSYDSISLYGAKIRSISKTEQGFRCQLIPLRYGRISLSIPNHYVTSDNHKFNMDSYLFTIVYDTIPPNVTFSNYESSLPYTYKTTFQIEVLFSEPVKGVTMDSFHYSNCVPLSLYEQTRSLYLLTLKALASEDTFTVTVKPNVIHDKAGNYITDTASFTMKYQDLILDYPLQENRTDFSVYGNRCQGNRYIEFIKDNNDMKGAGLNSLVPMMECNEDPSFTIDEDAHSLFVIFWYKQLHPIVKFVFLEYSNSKVITYSVFLFEEELFFATFLPQSTDLEQLDPKTTIHIPLPALNVWHQVSIRIKIAKKEITQILYVDNSFVESKIFSLSEIHNDNHLVIGKNYLPGIHILLAHVKIYKQYRENVIKENYYTYAPFSMLISGPKYIRELPSDVTISFSKSVDSFVLQDLSINECEDAILRPKSDKEFILTLNSCRLHSITIKLSNTNIYHQKNKLIYHNELRIAYDKNAPSAQLKVPVVIPTHLSLFSVYVLWNEQVYFKQKDLILANVDVLSFIEEDNHVYEIKVHVLENGPFSIEIPQGIKDYANNPSLTPYRYIGILESFSNVITGYSPSQFSSNYHLIKQLEFTFLEAVEQNQGYIAVLPFACDADTIQVIRTPSEQVQIRDNKVTVSLHRTLLNDCHYHVEISENAFTNYNGLWRGYYSFSIGKKRDPFLLEWSLPSEGSTNIKTDSVLSMRFSTIPMFCPTSTDELLFITLSPTKSDGQTYQFSKGSSYLSIKYSTLTITPPSPLQYDTEYKLVIPKNIICSAYGDSFEWEAGLVFRTEEDVYRPTVTLSTYFSPVGRTPIIVMCVVSEPVVDVTKEKFSIQNGTVEEVIPLSGNEYKLVIMPVIRSFSSSTDVSIQMAENRIHDRNSNGNMASNVLIVHYVPLVAHWLNTQLEDQSQYQNSCSMNIEHANNTVLTPNGSAGLVYKFYGPHEEFNDATESPSWICGYNREYNIGSHPLSMLTVSFWYKLESTYDFDITGSSYDFSIVYKGCKGKEDNFEYAIKVIQPNIICFITGEGECNEMCGVLNGHDNWHHIVASIKLTDTNKGIKELYVDALSHFQCSFNSKYPVTQACPLYVGDSSVLLHDLRIYRQSLSFEDVRHLYQEGGINQVRLSFVDSPDSSIQTQQPEFSLFVDWSLSVDDSTMNKDTILLTSESIRLSIQDRVKLIEDIRAQSEKNAKLISIEPISNLKYKVTYKLNYESSYPYLIYIPGKDDSKQSIRYLDSNILSLMYNPIKPHILYHVNTNLPSASPDVYLSISINVPCDIKKEDLILEHIELVSIIYKGNNYVVHIRLRSGTKSDITPRLTVKQGQCVNGRYKNDEASLDIPFLDQFTDLIISGQNNGKSYGIYNQFIPSTSDYSLHLDWSGNEMFINLHDKQEDLENNYYSVHFKYTSQFTFELKYNADVIYTTSMNATESPYFNVSNNHLIHISRHENEISFKLLNNDFDDNDSYLIYEYKEMQLDKGKFISFTNNITDVFITHISIFPQSHLAPRILLFDEHNKTFSTPYLTISYQFSKDISIFDPTQIRVINGFIHSWDIEENTFKITPLSPLLSSENRDNVNIIYQKLYLDEKDVQSIDAQLYITLTFPPEFAKDREGNPLRSDQFIYIYDPSRPNVTLTFDSEYYKKSGQLPYLITATFSKPVMYPLASSIVLSQAIEYQLKNEVDLNSKVEFGYVHTIKQVDNEGKVFTFEVYPHISHLYVSIGAGGCKDLIGNNNMESNRLYLHTEKVSSILLKTKGLYNFKHPQLKISTLSSNQFSLRLSGKQADIYFCENDISDVCIQLSIYDSTITVYLLHNTFKEYTTSKSFPVPLLHPIQSRLFTFIFDNNQLSLSIENPIVSTLQCSIHIPNGFPSLSYIYFGTDSTPLFITDITMTYELYSPPVATINVVNTLPITAYPIVINVNFNEEVTDLTLDQIIILNGVIFGLENYGNSYSFLIYPSSKSSYVYSNIDIIIPSGTVESKATHLKNSETYKSLPLSSIIHSYTSLPGTTDIGWREKWKGSNMNDIEIKYSVYLKKKSTYKILFSSDKSISHAFYEFRFCGKPSFVLTNSTLFNDDNLYTSRAIHCTVKMDLDMWIKIKDNHIYVGDGIYFGEHILFQATLDRPMDVLYFLFVSDTDSILFKNIDIVRKEGVYLDEDYQKPLYFPSQFFDVGNGNAKVEMSRHYRKFKALRYMAKGPVNRGKTQEVEGINMNINYDSLFNNTMYFNLDSSISSVTFEAILTPYSLSKSKRYLFGMTLSSSLDSSAFPFFFGLRLQVNTTEYNLVVFRNNRLVYTSIHTVTNGDRTGMRLYRDQYSNIYAYYCNDLDSDEPNWLYLTTIYVPEKANYVILYHASEESQIAKIDHVKIYKTADDLSYMGCYNIDNINTHVSVSRYISSDICRGECYNKGYIYAGFNKVNCVCTSIYRAYDKVSNHLCLNDCKDTEYCGVNHNIALYSTYGYFIVKDDFTYSTDKWYLQYNTPSNSYTSFNLRDSSLHIISSHSELRSKGFSYIYTPAYNDEYYISVKITVPVGCVGGLSICTNDDECDGSLVWDRRTSNVVMLSNMMHQYKVYVYETFSLYLRVHYKSHLIYGEWREDDSTPWKLVLGRGLNVNIDGERVALLGFYDSNESSNEIAVLFNNFVLTSQTEVPVIHLELSDKNEFDSLLESRYSLLLSQDRHAIYKVTLYSTVELQEFSVHSIHILGGRIAFIHSISTDVYVLICIKDSDSASMELYVPAYSIKDWTGVHQNVEPSNHLLIQSDQKGFTVRISSKHADRSVITEDFISFAIEFERSVRSFSKEQLAATNCNSMTSTLKHISNSTLYLFKCVPEHSGLVRVALYRNQVQDLLSNYNDMSNVITLDYQP